MFEQTFVQTQAQTRKPWTVAASLSLQFIIIAVLLLLPLLHPEKLRMPDPQPHLIRMWISQPPLPPQRTNTRNTISAPVPSVARPFVFVPPNTHPGTAQKIDIPSGDPELSAWTGPAGAPFSPSLTGVTSLPPRAEVQPPRVPSAPKTIAGGPLKVGGDVAAAKLTFGPAPAYPPIAKAARSEGLVKMEAIIATDGSIRNLRVVSGPPLLVNAALEAVRQWRYHPTLLNGVAVEVITEIDVNFSLTH